MRIAGTPVDTSGLLILFYMLGQSERAEDIALCARLNEAALLDDTDATDVALSPAERRDIVLGVLDDAPDPLVELRAVLLKQREWRVREGLA